MDQNAVKNPMMIAFYQFRSVTDPEQIRVDVELKAKALGALGLILVGHEGINGTVCIPQQNASEFQNMVSELFPGILFKTAQGTPTAFLKLKVKVRDEIVTMDRPGMVPTDQRDHIEAEEWHDLLISDVQVLDVRNDYEVRIGKFENAIDFQIEDFSEFPERVRTSNLDRNKTTLIYCTGGIRCEKAILEMRDQGFTDIKQLNGGILRYFEKFGSGGRFDGECFVFDYRVAVQKDLLPSKRFRLCPHCGEPTEHVIECRMCHEAQNVCEKCLSLSAHNETCSKNCAHHSRMGHQSQRPHRDGLHKSGQT